MKNYYEKILRSISTREPLEIPFISLGLILRTGGIDSVGYLDMCSSRIADQDLIDWEDVRIDFMNFPDLLLTADGVRRCRKILENYVSDSIIADAFEELCDEESIRAEISIFAGTLQELSLVNLIKMYARCGDKQIRKFVLAEAYYRSILSGVVRQLRSLFYDVFVRVKYHRLLSAVASEADRIHHEIK